MQQDKKREAVADRRRFLKLAGTGVAAGGAALFAAEEKAEAAEAKAGSALYRETDHVRRYYELAR
jgi:hypothetical protein